MHVSANTGTAQIELSAAVLAECMTVDSAFMAKM